MRATSHMELNRMNCNSGLPVAIRRARPEELGQIMEIVADAAAFMHANGNPGQWRDGYPGRERIAADIAGGYSHAAIDATGTMVATFCFMPSPEPNYATIRDGAWQDGSPYHVIHRLACAVRGQGIAADAWHGVWNRTVTCVRIPTATTSRCSVCCFGSVSVRSAPSSWRTAHRASLSNTATTSLQNSKRQTFPSYSPPFSSPSVTPASPQPLRFPAPTDASKGTGANSSHSFPRQADTERPRQRAVAILCNFI